MYPSALVKGMPLSYKTLPFACTCLRGKIGQSMHAYEEIKRLNLPLRTTEMEVIMVLLPLHRWLSSVMKPEI